MEREAQQVRRRMLWKSLWIITGLNGRNLERLGQTLGLYGVFQAMKFG
jgi:hypothetical protein